ncbi:MAG: hypothetical protein IPO59_22420 [Betaproteobacteria bacterium]|nr:hypothetical protein [Betaproteobacteria bacterium]
MQAREAAALVWIGATFDEAMARKGAGVVISMQANLNFELPASDQQRQGFNAVLARLAERSLAFRQASAADARRQPLISASTSWMFLPHLPTGVSAPENFTRLENFCPRACTGWKRASMRATPRSSPWYRTS